MGVAHEYARKLQSLRSRNVAATADLVSDFPSLARELDSPAQLSDRPAMVRCRRLRSMILAATCSVLEPRRCRPEFAYKRRRTTLAHYAISRGIAPTRRGAIPRCI